jgi:hypothetical protein
LFAADSHFKFKSEQLEPLPSGNLFDLNLKSLATGLATIPFYQQVDIPTETFSVSKLKIEIFTVCPFTIIYYSFNHVC